MGDYNIANRGDKCPRGHRGRTGKMAKTTRIIKAIASRFDPLPFAFEFLNLIERGNLGSRMDGSFLRCNKIASNSK